MLRRGALAFVAAILVVQPEMASTRQSEAALGTFRRIRGQVVVDEASSLPLKRVKIALTASGATASPAFTDEEGRFEIAVPRTGFTLTLTKPGYAPLGVPAASLRDDDPVLRLARGAAVTGRVVDRYGDPIFARVRLRRVGDTANASGTPAEWIADADDLGEFRAGGLPAGRYEVSAQPVNSPSGSQFGIPTTLSLRAGQEEYTSLVYPEEVPSGRLESSRASVIEAGGAIRGIVIGPDGRAVGGAFVAMLRDGDGARETSTDAQGTFEFVGLPSGTYRVTAGKWGTALSMRDRGMVVSIRERQRIDSFHIVMQRLLAVMGSVLDEYGEPVEGLLVQVARLRPVAGRSMLEMGGGSDNLPRRTDDRGRFRVSGVPPGDCFVVVSEVPPQLGGTSPENSLRVYYPGTPSIREALPVRVTAGQDSLGVNITYAPAAGARVQGYAFDSAGNALSFPVALMESFRSGGPMMARREAAVRADGAFTFQNVPPGDYVIQGVLRPSPGRSNEFAVVHISVSGADVPPVTLRTSRGTNVRGWVILEGDRSNVSFRQFRVGVAPSDLDYSPIGLDLSGSEVGDNGTFALQANGPARISSRATPQGWWLKSAVIEGLDVSESPYSFTASGSGPLDLVVVFSDGVSEIMGRVTNVRRDVPPSAAILVFPVDQSRWYLASRYLKLARVGLDQPADGGSMPSGTFRLRAVPPGDYWIIAVDRFDIETEWQVPEVLAAFAPLAQRITVPERQVIVRDLQLVERARP